MNNQNNNYHTTQHLHVTKYQRQYNLFNMMCFYVTRLLKTYHIISYNREKYTISLRNMEQELQEILQALLQCIENHPKEDENKKWFAKLIQDSLNGITNQETDIDLIY